MAKALLNNEELRCPACKSVAKLESAAGQRYQVRCGCGVSGPTLVNPNQAVREWGEFVCGATFDPTKTLTMHTLRVKLESAQKETDNDYGPLTDTWLVWVETQDGHLRPIEDIEFDSHEATFRIIAGSPV